MLMYCIQYLAPLCCQSLIENSCFSSEFLLAFQLNVIVQNARFLRMSLLPLVRKKYVKVTLMALGKLDVLEKTLKQVEDKISSARWHMQDIVLFFLSQFLRGFMSLIFHIKFCVIESAVWVINNTLNLAKLCACVLYT